jgi:hypothetical protein
MLWDASTDAAYPTGVGDLVDALAATVPAAFAAARAQSLLQRARADQHDVVAALARAKAADDAAELVFQAALAEVRRTAGVSRALQLQVDNPNVGVSDAVRAQRQVALDKARAEEATASAVRRQAQDAKENTEHALTGAQTAANTSAADVQKAEDANRAAVAGFHAECKAPHKTLEVTALLDKGDTFTAELELTFGFDFTRLTVRHFWDRRSFVYEEPAGVPTRTQVGRLLLQWVKRCRVADVTVSAPTCSGTSELVQTLCKLLLTDTQLELPWQATLDVTATCYRQAPKDVTIVATVLNETTVQLSVDGYKRSAAPTKSLLFLLSDLVREWVLTKRVVDVKLGHSAEREERQREEVETLRRVAAWCR